MQRGFTDFGDQWNYAMRLPSEQPWTMKLDPDERISEELWQSLERGVSAESGPNGFHVRRRLWFMGKALHVSQVVLRVWRTGTCKFTDVLVNEHPIVEGELEVLNGILEHHDSRDLQHWADKQNHYSSMEALTAIEGRQLAAEPKLFGSSMQRRMWFKKNFFRIPFRYKILWMALLFGTGAWRDGRTGLAWVQMRLYTRRLREYKIQEMKVTRLKIRLPSRQCGAPDSRVEQAKSA